MILFLPVIGIGWFVVNAGQLWDARDYFKLALLVGGTLLFVCVSGIVAWQLFEAFAPDLQNTKEVKTKPGPHPKTEHESLDGD